MYETKILNVVDVGERFEEIAPKTKEHLAVYCATVLNNRFPHPKSNNEYCIKNGHESPLDAIWAAYSESEDLSIWYAMRGSGKTYQLSILSWLESVFKPKCGTTILGGSLEQSTRAVGYAEELWKIKGVPSNLLVGGNVTGRGYKLKNGSWVKAIAASTKAARGPHPQKLRLDECLTGDTLIKTIDGYKKIKDITNKDIIFGWNGCEITNGMVRYLCCVGKKQTYKVYFSNGNFINCTDNHKILTTKGYLYLYEIKRRKCKGETIYSIGKSKNLFEMWKGNKFKKKIYNWVLSKMLYRTKFKQRKKMFNLWCKNFKSFNLLQKLLFSIKKRKESKMYRLWERIAATINGKMQNLLFKTFIKCWYDSKNGSSKGDSIEKKSIKSRNKNNGIIRLFKNIISISSFIWKICFRFFMQRFKFNNRSSWRILAREKNSNRKRFKKKEKIRRRRVQCIRIKNSIYAFLGIKNYGIYEILKIEKDKINDVYDLNVQELHSFMANDIIVHNCDEMDEKVYNSSLGQPKTNYGIKDNIVISSTLHNAFGLMSKVIDERHEKGAKLYQWCINEVLEPNGFWTNEEFERKKKQLTKAMLDSEYYLKRPKVGESIFDFASIDRSYIRGLKTKFIKNVYTEAGIDWGHTCTVINIIQNLKEWFNCPISKSWEYQELTDKCNEIADLCIEYKISVLYCDSNPKEANITLEKVLKKKRVTWVKVIPVSFNKWKTVAINVLRFLLEKDLINIKDKILQDKMKKYHYKNVDMEIIAKEDDHYPDALIAWAASKSYLLGNIKK